MLIPGAVGAGVGWAIGRSRVAQWLTVAATAAGAYGAVLAAWVVIPGIPSTGGMMPHHSFPYQTRDLLLYSSLSLMYLTPLILGFVLGSVNSFTRDQDGWRRFRLCGAACVCVIAVGVFLLWVVAF
jgi:hypothetical protein